MKKILNLIIFFATLLIFNIAVFAGDWVNMPIKYNNKIEQYSAGKIYINIDGKEIENFRMEPIILKGRVLVPLRDVFENMGATVNWEETKKEVIVQKGNDTISFVIDNYYGLKNGKDKFFFDVPSKIINDYTMVPIRAISDAFNYNVEWNNDTRRVTITHLEENTETINSKENGLKIIWDQIGSVQGNNSTEKRKAIEGLDVLCPTWFEIKNENGDINDKGSLEYANWAKEQGYQLWGLITNSFDADITHSILSDTTKRTKLINDILALAKKYNLDGINIDFESIAKTDGEYYLQFIKEATPIFKSNGLIVSVDMYVPTKWTEHYHMKEVGEIVDYVIIMAYDEHYSTSKVSGSVSSIPWADEHMKKATELVDKNKLIMGVPFYTRIWTETKNADGSVSVVSKSLKMDEAIDILKKNNAEIYWDYETGQYYGEYFSEGTTKKIWLEEERSMEERMKISREYDLKGVACWKRGHEKEGIWEVINKY
ncbi:MAG: hypothetical protein K2L15_03210, partial [Eubacteriales bacterium]|nr:hypothetical protein [Eubacteriales bacterium]